jgi:hypothetical protein
MNDDLPARPHHYFVDPRQEVASVGTMMVIDPLALKTAAEALGERLRSEASEQNAYVISFPDGRVSLELEWIDTQAIARHVIAAYLDQIANPRA